MTLPCGVVRVKEEGELRKCVERGSVGSVFGSSHYTRVSCDG